MLILCIHTASLWFSRPTCEALQLFRRCERKHQDQNQWLSPRMICFQQSLVLGTLRALSAAWMQAIKTYTVLYSLVITSAHSICIDHLSPLILLTADYWPANYSTSQTHIPAFNGPFSGTTWVSRYQKGKTNLDFTEARDSEWQWHQLGHMQVCISLQTDNHASTPPLSFLQARCSSCRPTNSVKALKAYITKEKKIMLIKRWWLPTPARHKTSVSLIPN